MLKKNKIYFIKPSTYLEGFLFLKQKVII
jgi:hypothetical protein